MLTCNLHRDESEETDLCEVSVEQHTMGGKLMANGRMRINNEFKLLLFYLRL